jgi:Tol biopolymer transport system component
VLSPDRSKIAYSKQNPATFAQELWVIDANGSNEHLLYTLGGNGVTASWSPDSSKLIFATAYEMQPGNFLSKAIVVNATGAPNPILLLPNDAPPAGEIAPGFDPADGSKVVFKDNFGRSGSGAGRYYTVGVNGSNLTPLDWIQPYGDGGVVWSPLGDAFYFVSGSSTIYRADLQSQSSSIVTSDLSDGPTRWSLSPQGDRIAFTTRRNTGKPVTGVVKTDGTGYLQLALAYPAGDPAGCYSPIWSPTEADVIMHCYPGSGAISIYRVSSTASTPTSPTLIGGQFRSREPVYAGLRPTR